MVIPRPQYSPFWLTALAGLACHLVTILGEGDALDLVQDVADHPDWSDELEYLALRILKPNAPVGLEREG
jgi:hypothetical protein